MLKYPRRVAQKLPYRSVSERMISMVCAVQNEAGGISDREHIGTHEGAGVQTPVPSVIFCFKSAAPAKIAGPNHRVVLMMR